MASAAHARLDLVRNEQDPMLLGQLAQSWEKVVRRDQVTALALDRLNEDRGHALGGRDRSEELLDPVERLVGGHVPRGARDMRVEDGPQQRRQPAPMARHGSRERERAEGPAMERLQESW